jgi:Arc/MetJ-type ribon-helix-helix transcriptional regulator
MASPSKPTAVGPTGVAKVDIVCAAGVPPVMKTVAKNVSLPRELAEFARQQQAAQAYPSFSAYVVDLFRRERQKLLEQDLALLDRVPAEPEPGPEFWRRFHRDAWRRRVDARRATRRRLSWAPGTCSNPSRPGWR